VVEIVQETPDLASLEILRRVRESGYEGGKTALYALVASLRPKPVKPLVRFEGLPGEFSQHDFGQVEVEFRNGASQRVHFFASRLKYSRWVRVSLVADEAVESLVRTLAEHLASWGGRPLLCVFDRPKTIALKWHKNGEVTEWNAIFAYATLEMGVGVELCWPYRAQQKGSVENLVGFVKSSFFKVRRFHDEEDLRQQLHDWHREVNQERPCRATGIIPALRLAEEAPRLRALKVQPEQLALRIPVYVGPTGTVLHDGHAYSMPPEAISMPATLTIFVSTSFNCNFSGRLTPSNNRLPSPATIGPTTKRYSSTRPSSISCEGMSTPPTKIFLPCSCFNLSISSRRFVRTILVFLSSARSNDREKTILLRESNA